MDHQPIWVLGPHVGVGSATEAQGDQAWDGLSLWGRRRVSRCVTLWGGPDLESQQGKPEGRGWGQQGGRGDQGELGSHGRALVTTMRQGLGLGGGSSGRGRRELRVEQGQPKGHGTGGGVFGASRGCQQGELSGRGREKVEGGVRGKSRGRGRASVSHKGRGLGVGGHWGEPGGLSQESARQTGHGPGGAVKCRSGRRAGGQGSGVIVAGPGVAVGRRSATGPGAGVGGLRGKPRGRDRASVKQKGQELGSGVSGASPGVAIGHRLDRKTGGLRGGPGRDSQASEGSGVSPSCGLEGARAQGPDDPRPCRSAASARAPR